MEKDLKAVLSNKIYLHRTDELEEYLLGELTYEFSPGNTSSPRIYICNYSIINKDLCSIPIGRQDLIPKNYNIIDKRIDHTINFPNTNKDIVLRPSQQDVVDKVDDNWIINAKPGWGKSFTVLFLAKKLSQKTLIIVHTLKLRKQWEIEIKKVFGITPSIIGGGDFNVDGPIVIANIQTLVKYIDKVANLFGLTVFDECLDYEVRVDTLEYGKKKIGTIVNQKIDCSVKSWNGEKFVYNKVINYFKNKQDYFLYYKFDNGTSLKCTENHSLYVYRNGKIEKDIAKNIIINDYIVSDEGKNINNYCIIQVTDVDICKATSGYRYNIEVENTHNYLANNKLVGNCHHLPSDMLTKVVDNLRSRYKIGLTGTLGRKDKKHILIPNYISRKVYIPPKENVVDPTIIIYPSKFQIPGNGMVHWATRMNDLAYNPAYQDEVVNIVNAQIDRGHKVLILSDRIIFLEQCAKKTDKAVCIVAKTKNQKELEQSIKIGKNKALYGSIGIYKEGISINELSCLILASPTNNIYLLEQVVGRIMRISPNKMKPEVIDIVLQGTTGKKQFKTRQRFYNQERFKIVFL